MKTNRWFAGLVFSLGVTLFALAMFRVVLPAGRVLNTTDDNIGLIAAEHNRQVASGWHDFVACWHDSVAAGLGAKFNPPKLTSLLVAWLPPVLFVNWIHAVYLLASTLLLALYLRRRKLGWAAISLGCLAAFWIGTNLTLTYAGHIGKYAVIFFSVVSLYAIDRAADGPHRWPWSVLAGAGVGLMFLEQGDVALFCGLFLGAYALYALLRRAQGPWLQALLPLIPMALVALLVAAPGLFMNYEVNIQQAAAVQSEDARAKWEYATQWSWPPEESIDFVAPGYTGWRSSEPSGPYWGRMGRTAGWERTHQGFMNFKLENQYLSALSVVFALVACAAGLRANRADTKSSSRADILFWAGAMGVSLLLSFGKYTPIYALFYRLPMIGAIRNPNKFLHVFQIAVGILAAFGLDAMLQVSEEAAPRGRASKASESTAPILKLPWYVLGVWAVAILFVLWTLALVLAQAQEASRLMLAGWGDYGAIIARNKLWAVGHAAVMFVLAGLALWVFSTPQARRFATPVAWLLVAVLALDALALGRYYIQSMSNSSLQENAVTRLLKNTQPAQRAALITQDGFYNNWLTYLFPYHGIRTFNFTQMPRMPTDYQAFLNALGHNPIRLWQLAAVDYVLCPGPVWQQIRSDRRMSGLLEPAFAYNVALDGDRVVVAPVPTGEAHHMVLRFRQVLPRYALLGGWETAGDREALGRLAMPDHSPFSTALVAQETAAELPAASEDGGGGTVEIEEYRPDTLVRLAVEIPSPALLRIATKYDPDWKAKLNGQPVPLRRVDVLFQGVFLPAGRNEVTLEYKPEARLLWLQAAGLLLAALAGLSLLVSSWRAKLPAGQG